MNAAAAVRMAVLGPNARVWTTRIGGESVTSGSIAFQGTRVSGIAPDSVIWGDSRDLG